MKELALLLLAGVLLAACEQLRDGRSRAEALAAANGWQERSYDATSLQIVGYRRFTARNRSLSVYIEGDGFARVSREQLSADPTPLDPTVFRMAVQDAAANRLYLGRPCQYLSVSALAACDPLYWDTARFSSGVVAALGAAIDREKAESGAETVKLYGWSGGGVVAALLAASRSDVTLLVTAAAPLDHAAWTSQMGVTPLDRSLNPADVVAKLQRIPQVDFFGLDDEIVSPTIGDAYVARMPDRRQVKLIRLPGFDHHCCWVERWPQLLKQVESLTR